MTAGEFETLDAIFFEALRHSPGRAREDFVNTRCPAALRRTVRRLLAADAALPAVALDPALPLPDFGGYLAEELIGSGGSGIVYRARRSDGLYEQQVAVKVLRASAQTDAERRRFARERQTLAQLEHPHIARLLDGGVTTTSEPYLVMEFVKGEAVDRYCDGRRLRIRDRLELFRQVLDAVAYSHRNFVLHGDLKPSNIFVAEESGVKLLDFGSSRFSESGENTTVGRALTPRYASPEQLRGDPGSALSEVFSLGVVLYELLAGAAPFGSGQSFVSTWERSLMPADPIPFERAAMATAADARSTNELALRKDLRGDLSSIVSKALAYEPGARYSTVTELAEDLDRYLTGRPILARPQTWTYRAAKLLRRHRRTVIAAALVGVALLGISAYAYRQRQHSIELAQQHEQALMTSFDLWQKAMAAVAEGVVPASFRDVPADITKSLESQEAKTPADPRTALRVAAVRETIGELEWRLEDPAEAVKQQSEAIRLLESVPISVEPKLPQRLFGSYMSLASRQIELGGGEQGLRNLTRAWVRLLPQLPRPWDGERGASYDMLADRLGAIDRAPDSPVWKNARRLRSAMPVEFARQEAIRFYRRSLEGAPDSPFRVQRHLGEMLVNTGSAGEARELFQAALAQRDRRCSGTGCEREEAADLRDLAEVEEGAGKASEGRKLWVEATSIVNRLYRDYPWDAAIGRFWVRHTLRWARAHNARAEAQAGLEKMDQLASGEHAPIDFVDFAARTYLEVVPASLRNRAKARDYAMRAVSRSNGQVAEYLATLAAVTDDPGDVRKAAGVSWKEGEIVRPLVPAGAVAEFDRTQKLLEQMARGAQ